MRARLLKKHGAQRGFTLLEVVVATAILMVVSVGLLSLFAMVIARNSDVGEQGTKVTEFAADKMEQLMALPFNDITSDLTKNPTCSSSNGCTPSGGTAVGLKAGGSVADGDASKAGYYDYIDINGNTSTTKPNFGYFRQWKIDNSTATLKSITVRVSVVGGVSPLKRTTTLISQKADF